MADRSTEGFVTRAIAIAVCFSCVQSTTHAEGRQVGPLQMQISNKGAEIYLYTCETVPSRSHNNDSVATNDGILSIALRDYTEHPVLFIADTDGRGSNAEPQKYARRGRKDEYKEARSVLTVGTLSDEGGLQCSYAYKTKPQRRISAVKSRVPAQEVKLEWEKLDIDEATPVTIVVTFITDQHYGAAVFVFYSTNFTHTSLEFYSPTSDSDVKATMYTWDTSAEAFTLTITTEENSPLVSAVEAGSLTCGVQIGHHGFYNCKTDDTSTTTPAEKCHPVAALVAGWVLCVVFFVALVVVVVILCRSRGMPRHGRRGAKLEGGTLPTSVSPASAAKDPERIEEGPGVGESLLENRGATEATEDQMDVSAGPPKEGE